MLELQATRGASARRRGYAADDVFTAVATEILRGDLLPEAALPPERVLSARFGVSKLLVRQAIHRLAESGLVRVRQGDVTRVLDPTRTCDLRVIELYYRMAPSSRGASGIARHVLEKQFTQGLSLVEVFARRATREARATLVTMVRESSRAADDEQALGELEEAFWSSVATGGGNRILEAEVAWWYRVLPSRPELPAPPPHRVRYAFYAELARRLDEGDAPVAYYVEALSPAITALFSRAPSTPRTSTKKKSPKQPRPSR